MKIAIDGPAGSGKSTIAKLLAEKLGFEYIDTGAMYRALAWKMLRSGYSCELKEDIEKVIKNSAFSLKESKLLLDGAPVGEEIRTSKISLLASRIATIPEIRAFLTGEQRKLAENRDVVMEGRDIGTVVLPDAEYKFYITASPRERARRRYKQLKEMGINADYDAILREISYRDENDSSREIAPLKPADDAIVIDTTGMNLSEVIRLILKRMKLQ
ncbi:cytidylate kinase [Kosmotoga arenicorallina S304]|uniref:Cytidylate kinase n=1 Tax=Kosmotoga arenicorallina S304 TaxID=1453497 RepID=A0A176JXM0_9BACT|nr:(d)CMP kinase [Kosmotoga arenicorallina]OAA28474.1 cytidylate kinase [Kosmotoga arenicorallina S304]